MRLELLLGRANTGKTAEIYKRLSALQRAGQKAVLIVPEQYTFEAERTLSEALGGLLGVEVLSFMRLNERILALSGQTAPFLSAQGHRMVIRRCAITKKDALSAFSSVADHPGFAAEMQTVFSDLARANLAPAQLTEFVEKLPENSLLRDKLSDIALLYAETDTFLHDRYLTLDAAADCARKLLPQSWLAGLPVFIDGVDRPSAQLYSWLTTLISHAESVTVALTCDPSYSPDAEVFLPDLQVATRLLEIAAQNGVPATKTIFTARAVPCAPPLAHLERNLFASPAERYPEETDAITVFAASDRLAETEALADAIQLRAREGVRYREMAVIVSDPGAYMLLIERVFRRREIPVFLDRKRPVSRHTAVSALLFALSAVCGGFPAADVLSLAKSGYAGVSHDDAEWLELYLLRTGLRGSALQTPFTRGDVPKRAEHARQTVMAPLLRLREGLNGRSVHEKVRAVYAYLMEIDLGGQLEKRANALLAKGRIPLMQEHAQVWNTLVDQLDQLDAIMGDLPMGRDAFLALFSEGLAASAISVIPSTGDAVLIGDVSRTKSRAARALFLLGVNDGLLPASRCDDGIIDDAELLLLARAGMPVWANSLQRVSADRLDLYTALSKARESLFIGFSFTGDGAELAPSPLLDDLFRIFPRCRRDTDIIGDDALPACASEGLAMLSHDLCKLRSTGKSTTRLPSLLAYYESRPESAALVRRMKAAGNVRFSPLPFGRALSSALYGTNVRMSASRLEQFASCPCKHFLRYGLAAADRKVYAERAADMGTFYHAVLAAFVQIVTERGTPWSALAVEDCDGILDEVLPAMIAGHNDGIFLHNDRLRAALFLTVESIRRSAKLIVQQIQAGAFTPLGAELRFGENEAFPPLLLRLSDGTTAMLSGIIDRVDSAKVDGQTLLRVVDYKLGGRDFDFSAIHSGLTLQLPLYLLAASQGADDSAGMYYMPLTMSAVSDTESIAEAAADAFRLNGITLSDASVILAGDRAAAQGASSVLKGVKPAKEGGFTGRICSGAEMNDLLAHAREKSENLFSGMLDGDIKADPAERACTYCDYRSVCRFDPMVRGCYARKIPKLSQAEFFAAIGGDAHALDD